MNSKTISTLASFLLSLGFLDHSSCQLLTAEYLPVKLPTAQEAMVPYYDGEDSIYLFGGYIDPDSIMVYSISEGTLEKVGRMPVPGFVGSAQPDNYGNVIYFGGGTSTDVHDFSLVFKFDIVSNRSNLVDMFPKSIAYGSSVKYNDNVYVFGGYGNDSSDEILAFDVVTLSHSTVATTSFPTVSTSIRVGNKAYVFGKMEGLRTALELDLDTLQMKAVGPPTLPLFTHYVTAAVWDGTFIYLMGGYDSTDGAPTGGIIQYDPVTHNNTFIPVRNFHVEGLNSFGAAPASVFVPSLNKIYGFGGLSLQYNTSTGEHDYTRHDEIFFIDLSPLSPPTTTETPVPTTLNPDFFSCTNRTNGLYPHPTDCSQFIGCQNGEPTYFSCPPPFLFDPELTVCNNPEDVECGTSCVDKVDGHYSHPHDCALYVICRSGVAAVLKCPPPLLFHPERLACAYPNEVECTNFEV